MLRSKSCVAFVVGMTSLVTFDTSVVEIVASGRKVVVVVDVVLVRVEAVVISGGMSGNLEVDVPTSDWPVLL